MENFGENKTMNLNAEDEDPDVQRQSASLVKKEIIGGGGSHLDGQTASHSSSMAKDNPVCPSARAVGENLDSDGMNLKNIDERETITRESKPSLPECSRDEAMEREFGRSQETEENVAVGTDDQEGDTFPIGISKKQRTNAAPILRTAILAGDETRTIEPTADKVKQVMSETDWITPIYNHSSDPIGNLLKQCQKVVDSTLPGPSLVLPGINDDNEADRSRRNGPEEYALQPARSKRPISAVTDSSHFSDAVNTRSDQLEVGLGGLQSVVPLSFDMSSSPSGLGPGVPLSFDMSSLLMEELLIADEEWCHGPKHAEPLHGNRYADMSEDDFRNMSLYMFTRQIKKHYRLNAIKQMPLRDQITLMKGKVNSALLVHTATLHDWRRGIVMIDYPGCPQIVDDIAPKRFSSDIANKMRSFSYTYPDKCRSDKTLILILCAVAFFDNDDGIAARLTPAGRNKFCELSHFYVDLLKQYLENTYGVTNGRLGFKHFMTWLNCIRMFAKEDAYAARLDLDPLTFNIVDMRSRALEIE